MEIEVSPSVYTSKEFMISISKLNINRLSKIILVNGSSKRYCYSHINFMLTCFLFSVSCSVQFNVILSSVMQTLKYTSFIQLSRQIC